MASDERKAVIVGISGCSSSGKTTLARILSDIFPNAFILHEDDFYKPDAEIPIKVDGLADWDCPESLSLEDMQRTLAHIRSHGALPRDLYSKEDQNSVGPVPVLEATIAAMKAKVAAWLQPGQPGHRILLQASNSGTPPRLRLCFLDGFLLYTPALQAALDLIDVRLFLRVSRAKATQRRQARDGYVTLEGFWQDPPGYMDKIVWPNYVEMHRWLFADGDVEGAPDRATLAAHRIHTQLDRGVDVDLATTLAWAVDTLLQELTAFA